MVAFIIRIELNRYNIVGYERLKLTHSSKSDNLSIIRGFCMTFLWWKNDVQTTIVENKSRLL
jgi:hypothetical protein